MIKIAIVERIGKYKTATTFYNKYYLTNYFKEIFDELEILLIPVVSEKHLDEICKICDGLVLTGSPNDVHPKYYGEKPIEGKEYLIDEYPLVKKIVEQFSVSNKPILGICAGIQEINVIFGGTLYQEIPNHKLSDGSKHKVTVSKNSFLQEVYEKDTIEVNSYHKQAIKDMAPNFQITAISEDGIIEAIEKDNIIAVQWHPEKVYDIPFFKSFIDRIQKERK